MTGVESYLTPRFLQDVRGFWFEQLENEDDLVLPTQEHVKRWFVGGKKLDNICLERFAPTLAAIYASGLTTGDDILSITNPSDPLDWLSLIIILDQLPRNCYRGEAAAVVFDFFDPIGRQIALAAIERGVNMQPEIRWRLAYRIWFFLPLMHSEIAADHEKAMEGYTLAEKDVDELITSEDDSSDTDKYHNMARKIIKENATAAKTLIQMHMGFEKRHQVIIQQFGRYPHRNKVLGREPTKAEAEYLQNGGETFG
ncbi:MFS sugar transporter [Pleurostoma richardsiae]|uniref:MFS sugar transporter n=1 Tax=Pleurostoma richardsiae TaxID=41990 RepID=A0AA38S295_9PEZI|nr:MFS sugar transporter [Pleurostoma richardsiae]